MRIVRGALARAALVVIVLGAARLARAQQAVVESGPTASGSYRLKIQEKPYFAFTEEQTRDMADAKIELETTRRELEATKALLAQSEELVKQYREATAKQREYVQGLEDAVKAYEGLARSFRKLKDPWVTAEVGGGVTGKRTEPALMAGLGIRALRIWGFAQKDNAGALLGLSLTVF